MGYSIELNLSTDSAERVVELWKTMAAQSINSVMLDIGAQPHISLAVFEDLSPGLLRDGLNHFASNTPVFTVRLASVGVFPGDEGVVFLAPVVTEKLLWIHERFYRLLEDKGLESIEYYHPGRWVPHCTVAIDVIPDKIGVATEISQKSDVFGLVDIDEVSLIEFRPVREIYVFPLRGQRIGVTESQ